MVKVTYKPSDEDVVRQMLSENGVYVVTVHNRHIVKVEKTVSLSVDAASGEDAGDAGEEDTGEGDAGEDKAKKQPSSRRRK